MTNKDNQPFQFYIKNITRQKSFENKIKQMLNNDNESSQNSKITEQNEIEELDLEKFMLPTAISNFKARMKNKELYEYNEKGEVSLKQIHPELQSKMDKLLEKCTEEGIYIKITESLRTIDRQNELYAKGRTTSGNIVTNAEGKDYSSTHQWGIAFDVCINIVGQEYDEKKLKRVGEIGKSLGLEWGGDWEFKDTPHFQLLGYSNIEELKNEYETPDNFADTWEN